MSDNSFFCIITSIHEPTASVIRLSEKVGKYGGRLIIIGDRKSPGVYDLEGAHFYTIDEQVRTGLSLAEAIPKDHYARKNIGYLIAMGQGASCIYETDDDTCPVEDWKPRRFINPVRIAPDQKWINVYRYFSDEVLWPRGFPLGYIRRGDVSNVHDARPLPEKKGPVQQGLVNGSPDVDAVWRLVFNRKITFGKEPDIWLRRGTWCPFNSQNTWWWRAAFPLMYLPSYCSFRMTDIWRSLIAQRCLWDEGYGLLFFAADVVQDRNPHDLMNDFEAEIPGYLKNEELSHILDEMDLSSEHTMGGKLFSCYRKLVEEQFFPPEELMLVDAWIEDIGRMDLSGP